MPEGMIETAQAAPTAGALAYQVGFANHFATEAAPGALPIGRNSPQRPPYGLYAEQISGAAFTAPRAENRRSWLYRLAPSVDRAGLAPCRVGAWSAPPVRTRHAAERLRWSPQPLPEAAADFVEGVTTLAGCGHVGLSGCAIHIYAANRDMSDRVLAVQDGELLIVPQHGRLAVTTELGRLELEPGQISVIPRGVMFSIALPDGAARGYLLENYGALLRLPELGPLGSNGLASPRDFETPVARYEDRVGPQELIVRRLGRMWRAELDASPFDVVAWHGNLAPYRYDLRRFNAMGTVSFDHPDPSIFTVLTSPSEMPGVANVDFVIFPPRWMVAESTFRPPWFHRNLMSEFMGLLYGAYDAKAGGFAPGGASLHNGQAPHGPDVTTHRVASAEDLAPKKLGGTLAFMFETRAHLTPTRAALSSDQLQRDYEACWRGFPRGRVT